MTYLFVCVCAWKVRVRLAGAQEMVEYKYVKVDKNCHQVLQWEPCANRCVNKKDKNKINGRVQVCNGR